MSKGLKVSVVVMGEDNYGVIIASERFAFTFVEQTTDEMESALNIALTTVKLIKDQDIKLEGEDE